jgi:hypothetical protein
MSGNGSNGAMFEAQIYDRLLAERIVFLRGEVMTSWRTHCAVNCCCCRRPTRAATSGSMSTPRAAR